MSVHDSTSAFYSLRDAVQLESSTSPPAILSTTRYRSDTHTTRTMRSQRQQPEVHPKPYRSNGTRESGSEKPTNKRRKIAEGDDENDTKSRGRPRMETDKDDETAAERRRTQIRLAQRAYRLRKETTISGLNSRVSDLESNISDMSSTFKDFHDQIVKSGLVASHSDLAAQLRTTNERFQNFARIAAPSSDEETPELEDHSAQTTPVQSVSLSSPQSVEHTTSDQIRQGLTVAHSNWPGNHLLSLDPITLRDDTESSRHSQAIGAYSTSMISGDAGPLQLPSTLFKAPQQSYNQFPASPDPTLQSSFINDHYTYSFQETTFARRLQRAALENAFRLLSRSIPLLDDEIQRVFRFTLLFSNPTRILKRLQFLLKRKAGEPLDYPAIPFVSLGGASLHFPFIDDHGRVSLPENMVDASRVMGPLLPSLAANPQSFSTVEELLDKLGFGGIWFDSHDVEEYLKNFGLYLNASSSIVDIDPTTAKTLRSLPSSPDDIPSSTGDEALKAPEPQDQEPATDLPDLQPFSLNDIFDQEYQQQWWPSPQTESMQSSHTTYPTEFDLPYMFDVSRFVNVLVEQGVCLGRAPGFRKTDVHNAVAAALQEVF